MHLARLENLLDVDHDVARLPGDNLTHSPLVCLVWVRPVKEDVLFPGVGHGCEQLKDLVPREWGLLIPILIMMLWIGLYPKPFLNKMDASVRHLVEQVTGEAPAADLPGDTHGHGH